MTEVELDKKVEAFLDSEAYDQLEQRQVERATLRLTEQLKGPMEELVKDAMLSAAWLALEAENGKN